MNAKQIWEESARRLQKVYERREAENIALILLEDVFSVSRSDVLVSSQANIEKEKLELCIERLEKMEPIQYVTGKAHFYGREYFVAPDVLIPRPETEELVDLILNDNQAANPSILDIGAGSGCIAISLSLGFGVKVQAVDISSKAIAIATQNASMLGADVDVELLNVLEDPLPDNLDIIVSNPPYIPEADKELMNDNVLDHEPEVALFVTNEDPLVFYQTIARKALKSLNHGGKLYFEIHENYGGDIKRMLEKMGYSHVLVKNDMQGKERMVSAINSTSK